MMRYLVAAVAVAPFVLLLLAMISGRADVKACCSNQPLKDASPPIHHSSTTSASSNERSETTGIR
ncbi:hypothetical protein [Oryzobacter terrae]|uniref:hypothetical protein n=1 Tax=Oryzobacter terrae TaxID=1620385 RepID=UPI003671EA63